MGDHNFILESSLCNVNPNQKINIMAHVKTIGQFSSCRTEVHGHDFMTDVLIPEGNEKVVILNGTIDVTDAGIWILQGPSTMVFFPKQWEAKHLQNLCETCVGIGALGTCSQSLGMRIMCQNDSNPRFTEWLKSHGAQHVVTGDITQPSTWKAMHDTCPEPAVLAAGVACQPFSRLGDRRESQDPRSQSLPGTLQAGFYLRSPAIVLECTREAKDSPFVQNCIQVFCNATKYHAKQIILDLHLIWPSRRSRWWCVLVHPSIGEVDLLPLPKLPKQPVVENMFPAMPVWTSSHENQLELDEHELAVFQNAPGGFARVMIDRQAPLQTALHSWGSQARGCACGCRISGFTKQRLADKGLFGAIVQLGGETTIQDKPCPRFRHIHPQEVALLTGLDPQYLRTAPSLPNLRLDLAGVGQLASPIQSIWILGQVLKHAHSQGFVIPRIVPEQALGQHCLRVLHSRDVLFPGFDKSSIQTDFEAAFRNLVAANTPSDQVDLPAHTDPYICVSDEETDAAITDADFRAQLTRALPPTKEELADSPIQPTTPCSIYQDEHLTPEQTQSSLPMDALPPPKETEASQSSTAPFAPYAGTGGINHFATNNMPLGLSSFKRKHETDDSAPANKRCPDSIPPSITEAAADGTLGITQKMPIECIQVHICTEGSRLLAVQVPPGTTVSQLCKAEAALQSSRTVYAFDAVGQPFDPNMTLEDNTIVLFRANNTIMIHDSSSFYTPTGDRLALLWQQQGRVAIDEMTYYHTELANKGCPVVPLPEHHTESKDSAVTRLSLANWVYEIIAKAARQNSPTIKFGTFLVAHHWIPIKLQVEPDTTIITTTTEGRQYFGSILAEAFGQEAFEYHTIDLPRHFPNDCGFQSVAWILNCHFQKPMLPFDVHDAIQWRVWFDAFILETPSSQLVTAPLALGGSPDQAQLQSLQQLLQQHGVSTDRSLTCAEHLVNTLGRPVIKKILAAPKPWADLKTQANQQKPPIKLVTSDELQMQIDKRIQSGQSFGRKQQKKSVKKPQPIRLEPEHIQLPPALFRQADGPPLSQLPIAQVNGQSSGIVVTTAAQAEAYFRLQEPVTKGALGLLILDFQDERIPDRKLLVRVPVTYLPTTEPIIVTAALLQIGAASAIRNTPEQCLAVEQVDSQVIRVLAYRDQITQPWSEFVKGPVKAIFQSDAFVSIEPHSQAVLDVWDRQFLTHKFTKVSPVDAAIFAVCLRLTNDAAHSVLKASGTEGYYYEPRSQNGREPDTSFKVVWLPKASHGDAIVAKQTSSCEVWLVRNGLRYGLRTTADCHKDVHDAHRPDIAFLEGSSLQTYKVGPLPWGTTRSSLTKVLAAWQWQSRPGQPIGQAPDHSGVMWTVQAATPPGHWIYTMTHGDVLISTSGSDKQPAAKHTANVLASAKTLQHIADQTKPTTGERPKSDPWLTTDPWSQWNPPKPALTNTQLATLEANVTKSLKATLAPEDAPMTPAVDGRVSALEAQVQQLSSNMQTLTSSVSTFQHQQQQVNGQVSQQIQGVKQQLDHQHTGLQNLLEGKLEEHISKIEALFAKRAKHQE